MLHSACVPIFLKRLFVFHVSFPIFDFEQRFAGGGGKPGKGGKGAGKGKYQKGSWERRPNMPRLLLGLHYKNTDGRPLCFAWNLPGGCPKGKDGACDRGLHLCSKCLGAHSYNECPQKGAN